MKHAVTQISVIPGSKNWKAKNTQLRRVTTVTGVPSGGTPSETNTVKLY